MPDNLTAKDMKTGIKELEKSAVKIPPVNPISKEYEIKYHAIFDSANDAIILMDRDLIIDCNKRTSELFRGKTEDIVGHPPSILWPEKQRNTRLTAEYALERVRKALHGEMRSYEFVVECQDIVDSFCARTSRTLKVN